ncbi:MAG: hypothetical protein AMXMBFR64_56200 [Myxococcales bacterium]
MSNEPTEREEAQPDDSAWDRRRRSVEELRSILRFFAVVLGAVVLVLATVVLDALSSVLQPLAIAVFLAYLILPVVNVLVRRGLPRALAYTIAVLGIVTTLYLIGELVALNVQRFLDNLDSYKDNLSRLEATATDLARRVRMVQPDERISVESVLARLPDDFAAQVLGGGTTMFLGFVGNLFVVGFFLVFVLLEVERLPQRIQLAYGEERATRLLDVMGAINASVQRYIVLKVIVSAATAAAAIAIMAAFGLDFWFLLGVSVFLFNFVPYVGSILATIAPMGIALLQFPSPWTALWLGLLLTTVQMGFGNLLEPALQGRNLNLSPLLILVALAFWGWLWGILGMVLAVPLMVTLRIALEHFPKTRPVSVLMANVSHGDTREKQHLERLDSTHGPRE